MLPEGKRGNQIQSVTDLGYQVWLQRRVLGMTQVQAALLCGVGIRFLSDLENGKATIETGRTFKVLRRLGLAIHIQLLEPPASAES